ncbi:MAG: ABC transporter ATP-binding protein [Candidatus Bathyarchaeia archaeon]
MDAVKVKGLTKKYGENVALNNINFECHEKEFLCFLGRPGAGKTTLLRIIAGLEKPDEGEVYIRGSLVNEVIPSKRDVAMVFQNLALYTGWTVYNNIASPLRAHKVPEEEIKKRVKEVAQLLRIEHLLDRTPVFASGGEKQRIAIARALVRRPQVYLMDEPLSNLDALLRLGMRVELKRMQRELGQTIIYVTPDQLEAMSMADRIALIHRGIIHQIADPETIYRHPATKTVAGFIGSPSMNFIDGSVCEVNGKTILDCGAFKLDISKYRQVLEESSAGSELILGIRPEHLTVSHDKISPEAMESLVVMEEPLGAETILHLKVGKIPMKAITPPTFHTIYGETVWTKIDMERIHLIDPKTEKVIL